MLSERLQTTSHGKNLVQCSLNTPEITLHRSKPYAMLSERLQTTLQRKKPVQYCLNTLGTTLHKLKPYAMLTTLDRKNPVQCCSNTAGTTLHREDSMQCGLKNIWSLFLHKYIRSFKSKNVKLSFLYYRNRLTS